MRRIPLRITIPTAVIILTAAVILAATPPGDARSSPAFEKLKSLTGTWKGKDDEGKPVTVTYKVVSAGTSVMETLDTGENEAAMVTMYHPDGKNIMMTHYCSAGNQPRMKAAGLSEDGSTLSFSFVDISNRAGANDHYMYKLVFTFNDGDHFSQQWSMKMGDEMDHAATFDFERVK